MPEAQSDADRIAELQHELRRRDERIKELSAERDEAYELVAQMREHAEDHDRLIDQWIDVFQMQQAENGAWLFDPGQSELWENYADSLEDYNKLVRQWNKFVGEYNARIAPREIGRPIAASDTQQADVLTRHKAGASLRAIASATSLSLRTIRTIIDKANGTGRPSKRTNELRRKEFNRQRAATYRARKAARDRLPKQITEHLKAGAALVKRAKGLGR